MSQSAVYSFVDKHEICKILSCCDVTLRRYRANYWIEGIHWTRINSRVVRYNLELIKDWLVNRHDKMAHQKAIAKYQETLCDGQKKAKK